MKTLVVDSYLELKISLRNGKNGMNGSDSVYGIDVPVFDVFKSSVEISSDLVRTGDVEDESFAVVANSEVNVSGSARSDGCISVTDVKVLGKYRLSVVASVVVDPDDLSVSLWDR